MPSAHDDVQTPPWKWTRSATVALVVVNIVAFIFQFTLLPRLADPRYFALSWPGLRAGYVWQLVTYMFMHGNLLHLGLNLWALFVFGRGVEWAIGKTKFLILYFSSGIIGGLVQALASMLWPAYIGGATLGASAGVFGVVAAFAMFFPGQPLVMLLFYFIPIKMRAKSLLWFLLIISALGIAFYNSSVAALLMGKNVAHFAHLGGILTGIAFARIYFLWQEPPSLPAE